MSLAPTFPRPELPSRDRGIGLGNTNPVSGAEATLGKHTCWGLGGTVDCAGVVVDLGCPLPLHFSTNAALATPA